MSTSPATKSRPEKQTTGVCAALLRLRPANLDESLIRRLAGNRVVKNLSEVAAEFGIEATTLRSGWRVQGMPGKAGAWPLADILLWRLRHEAEVAARTRRDHAARGSSGDSDRELERRQLEAETRKVELQAERLEREAQQAIGNLIDRQSAATSLRSMLAVTSNNLLTIPRAIAPSIPLEHAERITAEIERQIRRTLTNLSEKSGRVILTESRELESEHNHHGAPTNGHA